MSRLDGVCAGSRESFSICSGGSNRACMLLILQGYLRGFELAGLPGLKAGSKLEGRRSLNALLRPVFIPGKVQMKSKPMLKIEPGILHRRLYPLGYESSGVQEVLETAGKCVSLWV